MTSKRHAAAPLFLILTVLHIHGSECQWQSRGFLTAYGENGGRAGKSDRGYARRATTRVAAFCPSVPARARTVTSTTSEHWPPTRPPATTSPPRGAAPPPRSSPSDDDGVPGGSLPELLSSAFPSAPDVRSSVFRLPSVSDPDPASAASRLEFFQRMDEADRGLRAEGIYGMRPDAPGPVAVVDDAAHLFGEDWPDVVGLPRPPDVMESMDRSTEASVLEEGRPTIDLLDVAANASKRAATDAASLVAKSRAAVRERECARFFEEMDSFVPPDLDAEEGGMGGETRPVACPVCRASARVEDVARWGKCGICHVHEDIESVPPVPPAIDGRGAYQRGPGSGKFRRPAPPPPAPSSVPSADRQKLLGDISRWRKRAVEAEAEVARLRSALVEMERDAAAARAEAERRTGRADAGPGGSPHAIREGGTELWEEIQDPDTEEYFFWNSVTGETAWDLPE